MTTLNLYKPSNTSEALEKMNKVIGEPFEKIVLKIPKSDAINARKKHNILGWSISWEINNWC